MVMLLVPEAGAGMISRLKINFFTLFIYIWQGCLVQKRGGNESVHPGPRSRRRFHSRPEKLIFNIDINGNAACSRSGAGVISMLKINFFTFFIDLWLVQKRGGNETASGVGDRGGRIHSHPTSGISSITIEY
jgi:hypothetical protein